MWTITTIGYDIDGGAGCNGGFLCEEWFESDEIGVPCIYVSKWHLFEYGNRKDFVGRMFVPCTSIVSMSELKEDE